MEKSPLRVGLIGYGAIGQEVARLLAERNSEDILLVGALVRHPERLRPPGSPNIVTALSELLAMHPDVIVEVAGQEGLRKHGPATLRAGVDLLLVSIGVLAEPDVLRELIAAAQEGGTRAKIVSGAIGGLDALTSASVGGLTKVVHTMRRLPAALLAPDEVATLTGEKEVFRGNARQAAQQFPEFLNIAAAIALAGIGFDSTEVRVFADPQVKHSIHEVYAEGTFGILRFEIENSPLSSPPPRGAKLVAMSIVYALLSRHAPLIIG